ncbi:MAG TPA: sulfotransferase [Rhizomicrobium sp.]|jgi:tetratricopeptide (TPR) repeat protein|nr:sulfotransferase [Rhizomicrobium sp.]
MNTVAAVDEDAIVEAAAAALRAKRPLKNARLKAAADALRGNRAEEAERLLSNFLAQRPDDASALLLLAETSLRLGRKERALALLERCVAAAPDYEAGRFVYASTHYQLNHLDLSLAELSRLLAADPHNILYLDLKATVLVAMGRHQEAMLCRRQLVEDHPQLPELWVKLAKALRGIGEREAGIDALRRAIALNPACGSAWWTLADLKTTPFSDAEMAAMESVLASAGKTDRMYLHFALGKAYADRKNYPKSFDSYARANAMKRPTIRYDADWLGGQIAQLKALFRREFFEDRAASGADSAAPIFVVGLQRAGSTLVEQILDSHPAIEATAELPDITLLAEHLAETVGRDMGLGYPDVLATLDRASLRNLGENYLETTRFRRVRARPFFVDKSPYNFLHVGMIRLILPKATIIDVRRHPLACCWSNFSAHFESGALFAYRMSELGRAYAEYVELMAHFDRVLPGYVVRVVYEDLVADPEREIRRLLDHIGLPFDDACLSFHENRRAMDSVSSEQVRRPIFRDALDQWRNYEPWLEPLKTALGPVLQTWRE